ncbi:MAG: LptF/LptG family permease [Nostocaceae cyanobacterium]|nr:LptF/LptG family permease [Nostocaceae cyanobacterium]
MLKSRPKYLKNDNNKNIKLWLFPKINYKFDNYLILDKYIVKQLVTPFCFGLFAFGIVAELIGLSFEQARFIVEQGLPVSISLHVHILKIPAFVSIVFPFAILFAAIYTYADLSEKSEIVALQACGVSLYRLIAPTIALSIILAAVMFIFNELVVPPANYQAAIITEKAMNVDRSKLAKYHNQQIFYPEFIADKKSRVLKYLFYADDFDGKQMKEVTLLSFQQGELRQILFSKSAQWNEDLQMWQFFQGQKSIIKNDGDYGTVDRFNQLLLNIPKNVLHFVNHDRDNREMNIFESYQRLKIIKRIGDTNKIRQLQVSIQRKKAKPFACCIFAFVGSVLGSKLSRSRSRVFGITVAIIFGYYTLESITASFAMAGIISVFWGVWLPNLLGFWIGCSCLVLSKG